MSKSKILITGGSGFIGTNLIKYLLEKECDVFNIDKDKPKDLIYEKFWYDVDVCDFEKLESVICLIKPDYLVHLAAQTDLNETGGLEYYNANILGVENIVKIVINYPIIKRVIFSSSMLVNQVGYKAKSVFDYNPTTLYGKSKVIGEEIVFKYTDNLSEFCIVRPTSIWGENFGAPYKDFFNFVLSGKFFHPGNRACNKTYGYIGNTIYQLDCLLFSEKELINKKVFNIGDDPSVNISEWADEIASIAQVNKPKKIPFFVFKLAGYVGDLLINFGIKFPMTSFRLGNMTTDNILNLNDLYKICGNPPFTRIEGVERTLKWLKNKNKK